MVINNMKIKNIVFVSSDGVMLDEHFGKATCFWKYEIDGEKMHFVENVIIEREETKKMHEQLENILPLIPECDVIVAQKIGNGVKRILAEHEIYPLEYDGKIDVAVEKLIKYLFRR